MNTYEEIAAQIKTLEILIGRLDKRISAMEKPAPKAKAKAKK